MTELLLQVFLGLASANLLVQLIRVAMLKREKARMEARVKEMTQYMDEMLEELQPLKNGKAKSRTKR